MKQAAQFTDAHQQSKIRFILFNGLLKRGTLFAIFLFSVGYLFRLVPSTFADHMRISIFGGIIFGLLSGFVGSYKIKKDSK